MLFILVMDVLSSLVQKAEELDLIAPIAPRPVGHRISIYADDVVIFASPADGDLTVVKGILQSFGDATGLKVNMRKSSIIPICCDDVQQELVKGELECDVTSFPCRYLGLPLSLQRLTKEDLQPILDKIADALPGWKAAILATSGCLILVRAVLTTIPIYLLIALDAPRWFIKAVDKFRRAFLWRGRKDCAAAIVRLTGNGLHGLYILVASGSTTCSYSVGRCD